MTAREALDRVNEAHGLGLSFDGRCPGGEVGAHYARSPDGQRFVFKWSSDADDLDYFSAVSNRVTRLREVGYPAPRYLSPLAVDGGVVLLQEAVPGRWRDDVGDDLASTALRLNHLQAGQGDNRDGWTSYIRMTLTEGADGYCLHQPLREHGANTRSIVEWVEGVGASLGSLSSGDLVHIDFHHRNMLRDGAEFIAVVDWEGCRPGDRVFDLVTFCFGMTHAIATPNTFEKVWQRAVEIAAPDALRAYVGHMALRRVDWTIRHHPDELDRVISVASQYIKRVT